MNFYERVLLPALIDWGCGAPDMAAQRRLAVPLAQGRVLELGIGSGHNFPFYDAARVHSVIGVDPSARLLQRARSRSRALPYDVLLLQQGCEDLPLESASIDCALTTFTLCTLPDVGQALAEVRRVLKPGGRFIFCEHGRSPDAAVQRWQDRINPLWKKMFGGCHLNRDIQRLVQEAGFQFDTLDTAYMPRAPRFAGYRYFGAARVR